MEFNNDDLSLLYIMSISYIDSISERIKEAPKKSDELSDLLKNKKDAVILSDRLRKYLLTQGYSFTFES